MNRIVKGYSLIELLIAATILIILIVMAVPAIQSIITARKLTSLAGSLQQDLLYARSLTIKNPSTSNVHVSLVSGANWCYGISDAGACNCQNATPNCKIEGVTKVINSSSSNASGVSFTYGGFNSGDISFVGNRGTVSGINTGSATHGSMTFSKGTANIQVNLNYFGHITMTCTNIIKGYTGACS